MSRTKRPLTCVPSLPKIPCPIVQRAMSLQNHPRYPMSVFEPRTFFRALSCLCLAACAAVPEADGVTDHDGGPGTEAPSDSMQPDAPEPPPEEPGDVAPLPPIEEPEP